MQFNELSLDERIVRALAEADIQTCTQVQEETLVHSLAGRDVTVQSQTGTGKTIAFLVTALQRSLGDGRAERRTLIVAPTRELAVQIHKEAELVGHYLPHRIGCFYGGVGYGEQERLIRDGVDVVIGTPGRLLDYAGSGRMDFRTFSILIIDEADRLFDMGFIPDLRRILRASLKPTERQTMLFSATLGERVKQLAWEHMNEPVSVEIEPEVVTVREVTQELYHIGKEDKMRLLLGLLARDKPQRTLIFTNTKHAAETVARRLEINGQHCRYIMGDLPQSKRLSLITDMKAGKIPILVATDVAARGLHIDDVDLVVNYDLPEDRESYVHRIGRTARAGKSGKAVSLACDRYVFSLEGIESFINAKIPVGKISEGLLLEDASEGMRFPRAPRLGRPGLSRRDGGRREDGRRDGSRRGGGERARRPSTSGTSGTSGARGERRPVSSDQGGGQEAARREQPRPEGAPVGAGSERGPGERRRRSRGGRGRGGSGRSNQGQGPTADRAAPGERARPADRTGSGAPPGAGSSGRSGQGRERPAGQRPSGGRRDGGRGQEGRPAPRAPTPTPPPAPAPAPRSILDRIRGLFRGKRESGGKGPKP